jgi:hypothetical protein
MAQATAQAAPARHSRAAAAAGYLRASQGGLFPLAMLVGVGAGLGAVAFRYLISSFTWLATGHTEFGQQGRIADAADSLNPNPLHGFRVIEILVDERSPAVGRPLGAVRWPDGHMPVSVLHRRVLREADPAFALQAGDRVNLLT